MGVRTDEVRRSREFEIENAPSREAASDSPPGKPLLTEAASGNLQGSARRGAGEIGLAPKPSGRRVRAACWAGVARRSANRRGDAVTRSRARDRRH